MSDIKSKVDVVIATMGNLEVVKEFLESLYPLPDQWKVYIYDSNASQIDGTKQYLVEKQKELGFTLIDDGVDSAHGLAIEKLIAKSTSPWILMLDSDAKLLDKKFYSMAESVINEQKFKVWGRVDRTSPLPDIYKTPRVKLLRTYSWNLLFERKFFIDNKLTVSPHRLEHNITKDNGARENLLIWGDTSWQLFWVSSTKDLFGRYPDDMWGCWEHKDHSTVNWRAANREQLLELRMKNSKKQ